MADDKVVKGLPDDLARLLRDPRIIVPQDAAVFAKVAEWMNAPSDSAWAMTADEWRQAWSVTCRRMLDAQNERDALRAVVEWLAENMPQALELCPYKVTL